MPRMPSYHMLPSISNPYLVESSLQLQDESSSGQPQSQQSRYNQQPTSPKRFGYNPNAFYQKRQQSAMDRNLSSGQHVPVPPIPEKSPPGTAYGEYTSPTPFDPYARTESMTNRGRMSYASSAISQGTSGGGPRRLRRRKDPTPFNVLVVGAKNCGKTSFIEFLRSSLTRPVRKFATSYQISPPSTANVEQQGSFSSQYLKTELDGELIGLTLYDSKGLERHLADLQLREMSAFVESKFQETFNEEQKVVRAPGVKDTHIHCVFLVLDPSRLDSNIAVSRQHSSNAAQVNGASLTSRSRVIGALDEDLDIDVLRTLQGKTTVIPIISKADTITTAHMTYLKRAVHDSMRKIRFDPLEALNLDEDVDGQDFFDEADETDGRDTEDGDSSIFHDADEGEDLINGQAAVNGSPATSTTIPAKNTLAPSMPPQHDEIRHSGLSESIELPQIPMSVISPDVYDPGTVGRRFPWGFADPYNSLHCDFSRLRESVFSAWRGELREASRERWYEGWRTSQMKRRGQNSPMLPKNAAAGGARAVSGAATYGIHSSMASGASVQQQQQQRAVSANDIGIAVGSSNTAQSLPHRERLTNEPTLRTYGDAGGN